MDHGGERQIAPRPGVAEAATDGQPGPVVRDTRRWSRSGAAPAPPPTGTERSRGDETADPVPGVNDPAPLLRIGTMINQILDELRRSPVDEHGRKQLRALQYRAVEEVSRHLGPELRRELATLQITLPEDRLPSEIELRVAHAGLVGWLEGLFRGAQMAVAAQHQAATAQLAQMRRDAQRHDALTAAGSGGQYL